MNQKIDPFCPYCEAGECRLHPRTKGYISCGVCGYRLWRMGSASDVLILRHNYICRLVRLGKAAQELMEKPPELETEEPPYPLPTEPRDANHHSAGFYWSRQIILNRLKAALEEEVSEPTNKKLTMTEAYAIAHACDEHPQHKELMRLVRLGKAAEEFVAKAPHKPTDTPILPQTIREAFQNGADYGYVKGLWDYHNDLKAALEEMIDEAVL